MNSARQATSRMSLRARLWIVLAFTLLVGLAPIPSSPLVAQADAVESYPGKGFYVSSVYQSWEANGTLCVTAPISSFTTGHTLANREGAFYCYDDATEIWQPFLETDRAASITSVFGGDGHTYVAYNPSAGGTTKIGRLGLDGALDAIGSTSRGYGANQVLSAVANDGFVYLQLYDHPDFRWTNSLWAVNIQTGSWAQIGQSSYLSTARLDFPTIIGNTVYYLSTGVGENGGRIYSVTGTTVSVVTSPTWAKAGYGWVEMRGLATDGRYLYPAAGYDYFDIGIMRYRWTAARYDTVLSQWVQTGGIPSAVYKGTGAVSDGKIYLQLGTTLRVFEMANSTFQDLTGSDLFLKLVHRNRVITYPLADYAWTKGWFVEAQTILFDSLPGRQFGDVSFAIAPTASSGLTVTVVAAPESVCRVTGTEVQIVGGGVCTLTTSQVGDSLYLPAAPVSRSFVVSPAAQTITWTAPASATVGANVTLSGTSSSGRLVGYASLTPSTCGVAGASLVPLKRGTCRVRATVSATADYAAPVPVVADIDINPATQALGIAAPTSMGYGASVEISAQTTSGDPAEWTVLTPDICAMDGNVVTALATGDCTVSASIDASDGYSAASSEATIVVEKGDQAITFPALPSGLAPGHPITLNATASSGLAVAFQATGACSVGTSGGVTTLTPVGTSGSCTVVSRQIGDDNWNAAVPVTRVTTVRKLAQTILFSLTSASRLPSAAPFALTASSTSGLAVAFAARGVCTVSAGTVTLTGSTGVCTITASQVGDSGYRAAVSVSRSFNVAKASQTIDTSGVEVEWTAPGSTPLPSLSTAGLPTSWVSSTEEICVPDYDSDTQSWSVYFVDAGSCELVGSAAGNTDYMAATPVSVAIDVTAAAGIGIPGVTVDDGAEYTNELGVTVSLINVPDGTIAVAIGNDGDPTKATQISLDGVVLDGDRYLVPWRLQPTTLDGKLAKTVYVWFLGSDYEAIPYQDGIILDTTAPTLTSAVVAKTTGTGPVLGTGANATYGVTLKAADLGSGLAYVQVVTSKTATTNWVGYNAKTKWRGKKGITVYVRVKDAAGNVSAWKSVKLP